MGFFELINKYQQSTMTFPELVRLNDYIFIIGSLLVIALIVAVGKAVFDEAYKDLVGAAGGIILLLLINPITTITGHEQMEPILLYTKYGVQVKEEYIDSFNETIKQDIEDVTDDDVIIDSNAGQIKINTPNNYDELKAIIKVIQDAYNDPYYSNITHISTNHTYNKLFYRDEFYDLQMYDNLNTAMNQKPEEVKDKYGNITGYATEYSFKSISGEDIMQINLETIEDKQLDSLVQNGHYTKENESNQKE